MGKYVQKIKLGGTINEKSTANTEQEKEEAQQQNMAWWREERTQKR